MFKGIGDGFVQLFNIGRYQEILEHYKDDFSIPEWILVVIAIGLLVLFIVLIFALLYFLLRKYLRFRKAAIEQDELLEEVANLNGKVATLMKEKDEILAMKVSQLGLKPGESAEEEPKEEEEDLGNTGIRFAKLNSIDEEFKDYKIKNGKTVSILTIDNLGNLNIKGFYTNEIRDITDLK